MVNCIIDGNAKHSDVNMVYKDKYRLSELAFMICDITGVDPGKIKISGNRNNNLTGNSSRLDSYGFKLQGVKQGIKNYK